MKRICFVGALLLTAVLARASDDFTFDTPSDDRWHYPFNFTPGIRAVASVFGAANELDFPEFNDRDGIMIVAWETGDLIPAGQGPENYDVLAIRVRLTNQADASWPIDLTVDEWFTFDVNLDGEINADGIPRGQPSDTDGESSDEDDGRPIELFGAGFGPEFTYDTWVETSFYHGSTPGAPLARDPYPFVFQDDTFDLLHCEDSVTGLWNDTLPVPVTSFTPVPWAAGVPVDYDPDDQETAFDVEFDVDLNLSDGAVRAYFQQQLDGGRVFVVITSLRETVMFGQSNSFPAFFTKEGVAFDPDAKAPQLTVILGPRVPGDFDLDGDVDLIDYASLADCLAGPEATPRPTPPTTLKECLEAFDSDEDVDIDLMDLAVFALSEGV